MTDSPRELGERLADIFIAAEDRAPMLDETFRKELERKDAIKRERLAKWMQDFFDTLWEYQHKEEL